MPAVSISVVCPFYNEAQGLERAVRRMLRQLSSLDSPAELILVDDGSTDGSGWIAERLATEFRELRVLRYAQNRGRGYALRTGMAAARGAIIVTTEMDSSWGEAIVHELVDALRANPEIDFVIASPHLPGGGYRNVPWPRVWLSRLGNLFLRVCMRGAVTMNTGMTRAYRSSAIVTLPLEEDGKEFHLEVILKGEHFGLKILEIPAVLDWKAGEDGSGRARRQTAGRLSRLIFSHILFALGAEPARYLWTLGVVCLLAALASMVFASSHPQVRFGGVQLVLTGMTAVLGVAGLLFWFRTRAERTRWEEQRLSLIEREQRVESDAPRLHTSIRG